MKIKKILSINLAILLLFSIFIVPVGSVSEDVNGDNFWESDPKVDYRGSIPVEGKTISENDSVRTPLAPGYCISNGGNTTYEYISGINYTKNPSGTMIMTVEIFIANPTGCTYGNPCPEYDNSPEYVNVWVDWDGDTTFENHEKIIDEALTGYHDLNYYGTMTTSTIVTIPNGSANTTWVRTNLGWGHDPDDPCELSWTWGDVFDEQISTETDLPQIEDIIVTGPPGDESNPMTTQSVTLEAIIYEVSGYDINSVSWSGDGIPSGATGNPYTYTPAAGTHSNKNIQCVITYEKTATGDTGTDMLTKGFKLFFVKDGDEDSDGDPNWFEHWGQDGAVPRLDEANYNPTLGGYGCFACTGTLVEVGPSAAGQHYSSPITLDTYFGTESFGGPTVKGIDCAAEVVAHEFYHKWVWQNWQTGGDWVGETDSDDGLQAADCDDNLPDFYENTVSHTLNNDTDTYDLEHKKHSTYRKYGDNEYMAMKTGSATTGNPGKDWANPGKQSTPAYKHTTSLPVIKSSGPVEANFTGKNDDRGTDTNGDGFYEFLTVTSEVNVTNGGLFNIVALLKDKGGNVITFVNKPLALETGVQKIILDFDGIAIWEHGMDQAFNVSMVLSNEFEGPNEIDSQYFITSPYQNEDFQNPDAEFGEKFYEEAKDTDDDDFYNYLNIYVGVFTRIPGRYTVEGWLYDYNGNEIVMASNTTYLGAGYQYVPIMFDGSAIRQNRVDGPYYLKFLRLSDETNDEVDFIADAYSTNYYYYVEFQKKGAELTGSYESYGKDPNGNKLYDFLTVEVGVNVMTAGKYTVIGWLYDVEGNQIGWTSSEKVFKKPYQGHISLDFSGKDIYKHGLNGPYNLKYVSLIGENGILDHQKDAHKTSSYNYKLFQPLILLTGYYVDYGDDNDGNGLYENLTVCVEVLPSDSGKCVVSARLQDKTGKEILWSHKSSNVSRNEKQKICLDFDGRYIYANGKEGPYFINDVYVYHTGDAFVPDYASKGAATSAYDYLKFEKSGVVTGKVTKTNGDAIPNTLVYVDGVDYDYTDADGKYLLTILKNGTYTVNAEPPTGSGVLGDSEKISVTVGKVVIQDFVLLPEPSDKTQVQIPNAEAPPAQTVTVPITITNVTDLGAANIWLTYNNNIVKVAAISDGDLGTVTYNIDNSNGTTNMAWFSAYGHTGNFVFAYVTLKAVGEVCNESKLDLDVKEMVDVSGKPIPHTVVDGKFHVVSPLMEGDVSHLNNCVSMVDAMFIAQYVVGIRDLNESQLECADTTDEGAVSMVDAMHIAQWVVGTPFKPLWESPADDHMLKPKPCY